MTPPRLQAGFTLLEMLAATTLLALALGIVLTSMGQSMRQLGRDELKTRMSLVARSLMDEATLSPLPAGTHQGQRDGLDWQLDTRAGPALAGTRLIHLHLTLRQGHYEQRFDTLRLEREVHR